MEPYRIEMQRGAAPLLHPVLCWKGNRDPLGTSGGRNHRLISFVRERAALGDQPTPMFALCHAPSELTRGRGDGKADGAHELCESVGALLCA